MPGRALPLAALLILLLAACASRPRLTSTPVLYFALTDRFSDGDPGNDRDVDRAGPGAYHGGDLAGLRARLDYLAALGVDILWISPVVENVDRPVGGAGFPDWGYHGYWARDFDRIDPHLGGEADLRALVLAAHARGLRVLLDVVLNHPGYGSPYDVAEWTRSPPRGDCGADPLTSCLFGLPDFRTEEPRVADALIRAHLGWAARSGVDGFRCDTVVNVGLDVWARLAAAARAAHPGFLLVGEAWGAAPSASDAPAYLAVFDALFDFSFADPVLAYVTGGDAAELARYLTARGPGADRFVVFLDSHDTPGFRHRAGDRSDALLLGAVLEMTVPGIPLIYYGDEVGRAGGDWPANRSDMPWTPDEGADLGVLGRYRQLVAAHHRIGGPLTILHAEGPTIAYMRGHSALVAVNAGSSPATIDLPLATPHLADFLGWGATVTASATSTHIVLPARSAAILLRKE